MSLSNSGAEYHEEDELVSRYETSGGKDWFEVWCSSKWKTFDIASSGMNSSGISLNDMIARIANLYTDNPSFNVVEGEELKGSFIAFNGMFFSIDDPRVKRYTPEQLEPFAFLDIVINRKNMKDILKWAFEHWKDKIE
jgi:hypothetical protein